MKDPSETALIANDQSRETKRQAAVTLIESALENDFFNHGLDEFPSKELISAIKNDANVTLQSPVLLGDFNKLKPHVDSLIRNGDAFQECKAILKASPDEHEVLTDPHQLAYREGQAHPPESMQGIPKKPKNWADARNLYAAIGKNHQNNTQACRQIGALEVYIKQEIDLLNKLSLDAFRNEFTTASEFHGATRTAPLAQYHGSPLAELALPVALLGAYGEMSAVGGLESFVNRLNLEIESEKADDHDHDLGPDNDFVVDASAQRFARGQKAVDDSGCVAVVGQVPRVDAEGTTGPCVYDHNQFRKHAQQNGRKKEARQVFEITGSEDFLPHPAFVDQVIHVGEANALDDIGPRPGATKSARTAHRWFKNPIGAKHLP